MKYYGLLLTLPKEVKVFVGVFVLVLSIGFYTGLLFIQETDSNHPSGIQENYLGNEDDEEAEIQVGKRIPYQSTSFGGGLGALSALGGMRGGMGGIGRGGAGALGGLGGLGGLGALGGLRSEEHTV